jgi:cell division protease FtsH
MDVLHRLSAILIERETIDKDQFERLLAGATEEEVFPEEGVVPAPQPVPDDGSKRKPVPRPKPFPLPGATMQPPPPEGAKG